MSDNKPKAVMYCRVGNKNQVCETQPAVKAEQTMNMNRGGMPCGGSMYEIMSMFEAYDDITFAAMELILENGPDALMYQLNYDNIEYVKQFPTICKKAIELGILTEEELAGWDEEEDT